MNESASLSRYEFLSSKWKAKTITVEEESELLNWLNADEEIMIQISPVFANSEADLKDSIYQSINTKIRYREARS